MIDRLREPGFDKPSPKIHYYIEGAMVPIFDTEGEPIKSVGLCWEWANTQGREYEIIDVRYGSIDGVLLPEVDDIIQAIQEKMGLGNSLTFPDKFTHDLKL